MTYQVATLKYRGEWKVIHNDTKKTNQFEVYYIYHKNGSKHKVKVTEYADLNSAMIVLAEIVKYCYGYTEVKEKFGWTKKTT